MDTTGTYAFPFPELSDAPDVPAHLEALAEAIEDKFVTNDAALPRGVVAWVKSNNNSNSTPTVAEALVIPLTFTAVAGRTYRAIISGGIVDGTANIGAASCILRWAQGASVTTGGTAIARGQTGNPSTGSSADESSLPTLQGIITGQTAGGVTVGLFIASTTANAMSVFSTSTYGVVLVVEDLGATVAGSSVALL